MRISTNQMYARGTINMLEQQQKLLKLQNQFSSGLRVNTPSDDPIASSQIELINQRLNSTEIYQKNNTDVSNTLNLQDGMLDSISTSLQSLQRLQVQAGNGTLSEADRKALAEEVQGQLAQLQSYANSKSLTGEFLFSGTKNNIAAISRTYDNSINTYVYSYS